MVGYSVKKKFQVLLKAKYSFEALKNYSMKRISSLPMTEYLEEIPLSELKGHPVAMRRYFLYFHNPFSIR